MPFGKKGVTSRRTPRITVSEGNIVSQNEDGLLVYLSEFALAKFQEHKIVRVDIVFRGTTESKMINNYAMIDLSMDDLKFIGTRLCCLCTLRMVG